MNKTCDFINAVLSVNINDYVRKTKYLGFLLCSGSKTPIAVSCQTSKFYAQANTLLHNFRYCSDEVKMYVIIPHYCLTHIIRHKETGSLKAKTFYLYLIHKHSHYNMGSHSSLLPRCIKVCDEYNTSFLQFMCFDTYAKSGKSKITALSPTKCLIDSITTLLSSFNDTIKQLVKLLINSSILKCSYSYYYYISSHHIFTFLLHTTLIIYLFIVLHFFFYLGYF